MNKQQIANFMETFRVEVDSMASQKVTFDEFSGHFRYNEEPADVYGETVFIRVIHPDRYESILELDTEQTAESEWIEEFSRTFAELNSDVELFTEFVQGKYKNQNKI